MCIVNLIMFVMYFVIYLEGLECRKCSILKTDSVVLHERMT